MKDSQNKKIAEDSVSELLLKKSHQLRRRILSLDTTLSEEETVAAFPFNLPDTPASSGELDGIGVLTNDSLKIYVDGVKVKEFLLDDCEDFAVAPGVGSVAAECIYKGEFTLICRADASHTAELGAVMKRINKFKTSHSFSEDFYGDISRVCEKCGSPLPPGSAICPRCVDKMGVLKRLLKMAMPYKWSLLVSVLTFFAISAVNLLTPYINKILVDDFIEAPSENVVIFPFILVVASLAAVNLIANFLRIFQARVLVHTGNKVILRLRELVFGKIQMLSISRIAKRTAGELMNRVNQDTVHVRQLITDILPDILEQAVTFIAIGTMLFIYDWRLALLILCPVPLVILSFRLFWKKMHRFFERHWQLRSHSNTVLHDIFSGIRVVKAFGMEEREADRFEKISADYRDVSVKLERFWAAIWPFLNFFMTVGEFFLLYYVGNKILDGVMTLGEMAQFSSYVTMIYGPLRWVAHLPRRLVHTTTSAAKIFEVIDEKVDVADREDAVDLKIDGTVVFDNVSFGYDETTEVLKNVSLTVKPGEMIGIVGKSGVGKSTLTNLLMRLYEVSEGSITIDGVDLRDISQESLRSQIGVVLQETFLFAGTIYDNIAYAKPTASRDEIITAAKIAGAHEFIMKLPDAYNTKLGEKGHTISGGERQRISIARALLHNPRILILDEATASLDTETERQIQDALTKLIKDRTTIAIAHRLSTLRNATKLIVLDKGRVAEVGSHDELIKKKGIYYSLVMAQRQMSRMK